MGNFGSSGVPSFASSSPSSDTDMEMGSVACVCIVLGLLSERQDANIMVDAPVGQVVPMFRLALVLK